MFILLQMKTFCFILDMNGRLPGYWVMGFTYKFQLLYNLSQALKPFFLTIT